MPEHPKPRWTRWTTIHFVCLRSGRVINLPPKRPARIESQAFTHWNRVRDKCIDNPYVRAREATRGIFR